MRDYVQKYEMLARDCQRTRGKTLTEEMKGYQWLRQSRLSKIEVQMFLGSCNMMDGYNNMKRNLIRIFTKKGRNGSRSNMTHG